MDNFIFITPVGLGDCILQLLEDSYTLNHTQKLLKSTYQDIEFIVSQNNGRVVYNWGAELCISTPPDKTSELIDFLFKHENSDVFDFCVGVGQTITESCKAANLAELQKSESIVYYTPDLDIKLLDAEFESLNKDDQEAEQQPQGIGVPGLQLDDDSKKAPASAKQKVAEALMEVKKLAPQLAQIKESVPDLFDAVNKMVEAMIALSEEKG